MGNYALAELSPMVALLVVMELASGAFVTTYLFDLTGPVRRGFLIVNTAICAILICAALITSWALPPSATTLGHQHVDVSLYASMVHWQIAFVVATTLYMFFTAVGTDAARRTVGAITSLSAVVALVGATSAAAPSHQQFVMVAFLALPAAALSGTTLAGMLLGHWYLIAPDLSFRPLRLATYFIFAAVVLELVAAVISLLTTQSSHRSDLLTGQLSVPFWLLFVGSAIIFTALVNGLTLYFTRMRANQPATAMLYALIISTLLGTVPAHWLFFQSGVPV